MIHARRSTSQRIAVANRSASIGSSELSRVERATFGGLVASGDHQPIRRRPQGLPSFVVTRGAEYRFMPKLRALRRLADLDAEDSDFRPWTTSTTWW